MLYRKYIKRLMDLVLSVTALIVFLPLLLLVAVLIKIKLGSPVIFKQLRPGKNEKIFMLYKFRTMTDKRDESGNLLPDELRITKFGKWLRSTSMDELPELINILRGDMSIVGPRPLLIQYIPYYTETERHRHDVRPGLTGLSQINGRNYLPWDERLKLDSDYVNSISFVNDIKIIFITAIKVIRKDDVALGFEINKQYLSVERENMYEMSEIESKL